MAAKRIELEIRTGQTSRAKCGIYGAGKNGGAIAYALLQEGCFSELLVADPSRVRAEKTAAALSSALPFCAPTDIYAVEECDLCDCEIVILALECDSDVSVRAALLRELAEEIVAKGEEPILINATPPFAYMTQLLAQVSCLAHGHVFGIGGISDSLLLQKILGRHLGVDASSVHVFLAGDSDSDIFPLWSHTNVAGITLPQYCELCGRGCDVSVPDGLFRTLREKAVRDGGTLYTTAESVRRVCVAITKDENAILSLTCPLDGHYGLEHVSLTLPCVVGRIGVRRILEIPLDPSEEKQLCQAARHGLTPIEND